MKLRFVLSVFLVTFGIFLGGCKSEDEEVVEVVKVEKVVKDITVTVSDLPNLSLDEKIDLYEIKVVEDRAEPSYDSSFFYKLSIICLSSSPVSLDLTELGITTIESGVFRENTVLQGIKLPASVTTIESDAFYRCTSLQSVEIPDSVTAIGSEAFSGCISLQSVEMHDSVITIGQAAFSYTSLKSVAISASVTTIEQDTFYGCMSLTSVYIPASVITIEKNAFKECTNLVRAVFEDTDGWSPQVSNIVETTKKLVLGYSFTKS